MIAYIVTSGCYSDYSIRAVFSTKESAQALIDEWTAKNDYRSRDISIEQWHVDEECRPDEHHTRISVTLAENGDTIAVDAKNHDEVAQWRWQRSPDPAKYPLASPQNKGITFFGVIWARDVDHAVKVARDVRAASIAAGDLEKLKADSSPSWTTVEALRT